MTQPGWMPPLAFLTGGRERCGFLFLFSFPFFLAATGVGDRRASTGGFDHEDRIWLSFVRHRSYRLPIRVLLQTNKQTNKHHN
jgi:hypothetical protein